MFRRNALLAVVLVHLLGVLSVPASMARAWFSHGHRQKAGTARLGHRFCHPGVALGLLGWVAFLVCVGGSLTGCLRSAV